MLRIADPIIVFRRFLDVRETLGPNRGAWVQKFQREAHGQPGDSWCAFALVFMLDVAYDGKAPLIKSGYCPTLLSDARRRGYVLKPGAPALPRDIFFYLDEEGRAHHTGLITVGDPGRTGIAGNTSPDGKSDNGTGIFEHGIQAGPRVALARLPE